MTESALLVTMGGQAQVVTFALDWLLRRGETIREVVVLHLSPPPSLPVFHARTRRALEQLNAEFAADRYGDAPCRLRLVPIRSEAQRLADIADEADAEAAWQTIYQLVVTLKTPRRPLHLCIAGGRRIMGLLTLSAAILLCDHRDHIWHMYTPDEFMARARGGAILHARPEDGVRLIQVPVVPWGTYFPGLRDVARSPAEVIAGQTARLDADEQARCEAVFGRLTPRQKEVLRLLADGQTPQEVAARLHISLATVHSHKAVIFDECRSAWNLPESAGLTYHLLRERFEPFFAGRPPRLHRQRSTGRTPEHQT
jgi:CRISPR-associated protein Csx14